MGSGSGQFGCTTQLLGRDLTYGAHTEPLKAIVCDAVSSAATERERGKSNVSPQKRRFEARRDQRTQVRDKARELKFSAAAAAAVSLSLPSEMRWTRPETPQYLCGVTLEFAIN